MRLICPNCGAQYEVPAEVIPTEGRDVQCSNCSSTWFQAHPDHDSGLADESAAPSVEPVAPPPPPPAPEPAPEPEGEPNPAPVEKPAQRGLDPEVSDVLRQEAEYEASVRASERGAPLESQPDLGLEDSPKEVDAARRARDARARMARMRGEPAPDSAAVAAATAAASGSRRDLLPDIEEINSTLRASGERRKPAVATDTDLPGTKPQIRRKRGGFRRSFLSVIVLAALAVGTYIYSARITAAVPAAAPYMATYVQSVDSARDWLDTSVDKGLAWLDKMASENL